jgi:hypothetical protein
MLVNDGYWNLNISITLHSNCIVRLITAACSVWMYVPTIFEPRTTKHWWIRLSVRVISVTYSIFDCREYKLQTGKHTQHHHFYKDN